MKQLTRQELVDLLNDLWSAGLIKYSKYLELKAVKKSSELQRLIDEIIEASK